MNKGMKAFICSIAWRILWRWWPDRVFHIHGTQTLPQDERYTWMLEVSASFPYDHYASLIPGARVYEKLDHSGKWVR